MNQNQIPPVPAVDLTARPSWASRYLTVNRGAVLDRATGDWLLWCVRPVNGDPSGVDDILYGYESEDEAREVVDRGLVLECDPDLDPETCARYMLEKAAREGAAAELATTEALAKHAARLDEVDTVDEEPAGVDEANARTQRHGPVPS